MLISFIYLFQAHTGNSAEYINSCSPFLEQFEGNEHQIPGPLLSDFIDFVSFRMFLNVSGLNFNI